MSDIAASRASVRDLTTESPSADASAQDSFAPYRLGGNREQTSVSVPLDATDRQQTTPGLPDLTLTNSDISSVRMQPRDTARSYRDFVPARGTAANPTVGFETASAESQALLRHFDLIPGKANPNFIDARALQNYLQTNTEISAEDRRNLASAASHMDRIQQSSDDEWGRETSGISRRDAQLYPSQEAEFERRYTALAYARENFDEMAGPDGKITIPSLRSFELRRRSQGASRDELSIINDIRRNNQYLGPTRHWYPLERASLDTMLRPRGTVDNQQRNYADLLH